MARRDWTLAIIVALGLVPAGNAMADSLGPDGNKLDQERLEPGLYPASPDALSYEPPPEPAHPPFDIDWSVGLKGAYTSHSEDGGNFLTTINPQVTARHDGRIADILVEGEAEIAKLWDEGEGIEFTDLRLGASGTLLLNSSTSLSANAAIQRTRDLPTSPGLDPQVIVAPAITSGSIGLGLERQFGRFNLGVTGDVERTVYGRTFRSDTGLTDNGDQNLWEADASLRAGFELTPIFEVFAEASAGRDLFDAPSRSLGVRADATGTALRGGIKGSWNNNLVATASIGIGRHDFDAANLTDITTRLYDASITYSPNETLDLTAALSTSIEPAGADSAGTARVEHVASADIAYRVNSWLRLRASAEWGRSVIEGTNDVENRHGLGAGADYVLNSHTALSADYAFAHRETVARGEVDSHIVSLGVTLRR